MKYIMAMDQGTTSSRAIIYDKKGNIISLSQREFKQIFPREGWVEHDPMEVYQTQMVVAHEALLKSGLTAQDIDSIGITNQRETTVVWDKNTGRPVYNAIVWQCRRTAGYCDEILEDSALTEAIKSITGLKVDAYFSGTKLAWILDNVEGVRERAEGGELLFGTIETWLIWKMTGGKVHVTDYSNASRTMLFNIKELRWDPFLLNLLNIPKIMLPTPMPSSCIYGETDPRLFAGSIKIAGAAGDQQAALFGQNAFEVGSAKSTYGTGCFLLMNTGEKPIFSKHGLLTTIAWGVDGKVNYALEGSVFVCGAAIQWLRDELGIIKKASDTEMMAQKVDGNDGVYFVPAFVGLGAPYWDPYARGMLIGITRGTTKNHIVRATLESMAYQCNDLLTAMSKDIGYKLKELKVDGGACANNFLMQFQADLLDCKVKRPKVIETTSLGAAYLAGLATGYYKSQGDIVENWQCDRVFEPDITEEKKEGLISGWKSAVGRCSSWSN